MPLDYEGKISKSAGGNECVAWESVTDTTHAKPTEPSANYCRATKKTGSKIDAGAWCFINTDGEWEYCTCNTGN